jgi:hypothetical protein
MATKTSRSTTLMIPKSLPFSLIIFIPTSVYGA